MLLCLAILITIASDGTGAEAVAFSIATGGMLGGAGSILGDMLTGNSIHAGKAIAMTLVGVVIGASTSSNLTSMQMLEKTVFFVASKTAVELAAMSLSVVIMAFVASLYDALIRKIKKIFYK